MRFTVNGSAALAICRRIERKSGGAAIRLTDLSLERIKSIGSGHGHCTLGLELIFSDHVHELDTSKHAACAAEGFKIKYRPGPPLDGAMVLLYDVIHVFCLPYFAGRYAVSIDGIEGGFVGAAFVHVDHVGNVVRADGLVEEPLSCGHVPLGREQEIVDLAVLIDGALKVFPAAFDLDVGLVIRHNAADRAPILARPFFEIGRKRISQRLIVG